MNTDILTDEVLAEIERAHGDGDVDRLLRHAAALQAERDAMLDWKSNLFDYLNQETNTAAIEAFRQRCVRRLRESGDEFGAPEYYAAADIVESLPATEEVQR